MTFNTILAAVAATALSAAALPAVAQSFSAGHVQLSRSVGVAPGTLTTAQLIELDQAQQEGGAAGRVAADAILKAVGGERLTTSNAADRNGVNQRILLERAVQEGDEFLVRQLSKTVTDTTGSDRGAVSAGKAQLAAGLGVNAADYTTAELVALKTRRDFADNDK